MRAQHPRFVRSRHSRCCTSRPPGNARSLRLASHATAQAACDRHRATARDPLVRCSANGEVLRRKKGDLLQPVVARSPRAVLCHALAAREMSNGKAQPPDIHKIIRGRRERSSSDDGEARLGVKDRQSRRTHPACGRRIGLLKSAVWLRWWPLAAMALAVSAWVIRGLGLACVPPPLRIASSIVIAVSLMVVYRGSLAGLIAWPMHALVCVADARHRRAWVKVKLADPGQVSATQSVLQTGHPIACDPRGGCGEFRRERALSYSR